MPIVDLVPSLASKTRSIAPTLIVLHATAGASGRSSIAVLRGKGLSYHFIIARDGIDSKNAALADGSSPLIWRCVPEANVAFHVGSTVPAPSGQGGINKTSIGISLANLQNGKSASPEPYTAGQMAALPSLLTELRERHPSLKWLTTHAAVQPWNRSDPQRLDAQAIAGAAGLTWWEPTAAQLAAAKPPPVKLAA